MKESALAKEHPWTQPWYYAKGSSIWVLVYLFLIHGGALVGLILYPFPGWTVVVTAYLLTSIGGIGTTVAYHRALAHRAVKLNPIVEHILIFFAVFNASGAPTTWIANHRNHHAKSDTIDDVSSPRHGGFWWAHLRWLYQWEASSMAQWCPDLDRPKYRFWERIQIPLVAVSMVFGYVVFGWAGLFWLGAIRLTYSLHGQCAVNSIMHLKPGSPEGVDSSRNIWWVGPLSSTAWGENWHGNHHSEPGSACFSRHWWQVDLGWYAIRVLEALGLATDVRRPVRT
jgi:fatty-acid desaturase